MDSKTKPTIGKLALKLMYVIALQLFVAHMGTLLIQ
jgi:hypothetical protein